MDFAGLVKEYRRIFPDGDVRTGERLSEHTSFRIGGEAAVMIFPDSQEEVRATAALLKEFGVPSLVMGNGTNLLVSDRRHDVAVINTVRLQKLKLLEDYSISAEAGALLSRTASFARDNALTGFEFAHGIPGSVGGAVVMNAGAYGGEMSCVITSVTVLDTEGDVREYAGDQCEFSYRHSRFSHSGDIVLAAEIRLAPGDKGNIGQRMAELAARRRNSQPLEMPSAGSTFKRPASGYAAAMIEGAGLKGFSVGGAQVSEKHAGFLINTGTASFEDVLALMEQVKETVYDKFGVTLEPEVKIIR